MSECLIPGVEILHESESVKINIFTLSGKKIM